MFAKTNRKMDTLIGHNSDFKGELNVQGTLRIDGKAEGKLTADTVIVGETSLVRGEITAKRILVGGRIEGDLRAQEIVEIKAKAKVLGDIFTKKISVMEGGEFNGKIEMNGMAIEQLDLLAKSGK